MREYLLLVACVALSACMPDDTAHTPIFLTAPYNTWPPVPAGTPIEPGRPVRLGAADGRRSQLVHSLADRNTG